MAFNKPSTRTSIDTYHDDKQGHKNPNLQGVSTGGGLFGLGNTNDSAESSAREWAGKAMQRMLDNGIDLGDNQESFEKMFEEITRSYYDDEAADIWGANDISKIGPEEMESLCFVMSDLNEMMEDGRIDMNTYAEKMGELFSEESINALKIGGDLSDSAAFIHIANEVAEWHGDDPSSSRSKQPDPEIAAANREAMSVSERPVINDSFDYGSNRIAEYQAEAMEKGLDVMNVPGGGQDMMYVSSHQEKMVELIKKWDDEGLLPEGCNTQSVLDHINMALPDHFNNGMAPAAIYSARIAFEDLDGLGDENLKKEMIASIMSPEGFDGIVMGSPDGVDWFQELDLYMRNPDLQFSEPVTDLHNGDTTLDATDSETMDPEATEPEITDPEATDPSVTEPEEPGNDYDADVTGLDYSILEQQSPADRFETVRERAIEYYMNGTQRDMDGGLLDEGFSADEVKQIERLSMYGKAYCEDLTPDQFARMFYNAPTMDEANKSFCDAQARVAADVMTYESVEEFMAASNLANGDGLLGREDAERIYGAAAGIVSGYGDLEDAGIDSVGLAEAVANSESYEAESGGSTRQSEEPSSNSPEADGEEATPEQEATGPDM